MKQVYRSRLAQVLGWLWVVFAAVMAVDLVMRYNGPPSLVAGAVLAVLTAMIVVTSLRPATVLLEEGVLVRNPFRDTFLPWAAVGEVRVSHAIQIDYDGGTVRCWTPQSSARERVSALRRTTSQDGRTRASQGLTTMPKTTSGEQAAVDAMAGRTHADFVADQITERAEKARSKAAFEGKGEAAETPAARTTWSILAAAGCLIAAALVVVAIIAS
ncbi:PH domain-containing protein [Spongiactinospora sp. TRM90649]|uniref:PH domain-containing protein n=1 Tax=Spongiactinospora sp. TRM90649 TaxID=3031114 RepID=UPI0023F64F25|nr:PH domain-containing protein [Spongiactinospora sp. TRM90649]MDF5751291.1 PH domain-containing protein [Spongiactinospora sp. TRM90649]